MLSYNETMNANPKVLPRCALADGDKLDPPIKISPSTRVLGKGARLAGGRGGNHNTECETQGEEL
jgi:hypothetical protein